MTARPACTRRALLGGGLAVGAMVVPMRGAQAQQRGLATIAAGKVDPALIDRALASLARHDKALWSHDVIGIADFGLPSTAARFHLIDLLRGTVTSLRVTHGKGSDPDRTGLLQSFSDVPDSLATSEGAYLTGETYTGIHGLSRRLLGLDPTNAHAEARAIVIHSAWYAGADVAATQGKLGRSDGCFAFAEADIATVLASLGQGRLIYAGRARTAGGAGST